MSLQHLAIFAPRFPVLSESFVSGEALALQASGVRVSTVALRQGACAGLDARTRAMAATTEILYGNPIRSGMEAILQALRHPLRCASSLGWMLRDLRSGQLKGMHQARILPIQWIAGLRLARWLSHRNIDHLHVHFAHSAATVAMYASRASGIPFSVTSHANDIYVNACLLKAKIRRAEPFLTISSSNQKFLRLKFGPCANRVILARCGVDTQVFMPPTKRDFSTGPLLAVGRLVPKKGFDLLLYAIAELRSSHRQLKLIIAGDGPERAHLEELIRKLKIQRQVRLVGSVTQSELRRLLDKARAFVLPARTDATGDRDGIPVVLMEAMACGLPVISTQLSGIPELIENGVQGLLVPECDARLLAGAIKRLLEDPALSFALGQAGRVRVCHLYDQKQNVQQLVHMFRQAPVQGSYRRPRHVLQSGAQHLRPQDGPDGIAQHVP